MTQSLRKHRKDINQQDTWKLEDIFASDELVLDSFNQANLLINRFVAYKGNTTSSGERLLEVLHLQDEASELLSKLYLYCNMRLHQDATQSYYQDLATKSSSLLVQYGTATSFITTELSQLDMSQANELIANTPGLEVYTRHIHEILRQKAHILDAQTEALLAQFNEIADAPSAIFAMFNNADVTFPTISDAEGNPVQITHGNYIKFLESKDRQVRQSAFKGLYETYSHFDNTLAKTFASNVKQLSLFAKIRHYDCALESKLSANNIPTHVYTNLIDTVNKELPILHDYIALRKKILGVEDLHMYDLFVPLVPDFDTPITFDDACEIVLKALAPLGEDYVAIVKEAFDNRWIDKYENIGKRSGAYSWGTYGIAHPYVLLNYMDNLNNLFTLAHEMGHALHSYLSNKTQPHSTSHYCIFVAEVASTVNESLLMQYLLKTTTDIGYRKYLITYFMEQFRNTVYRQTMFAEFEKSIYELNASDVTLTTDLICTTYYDLVHKYHGPHMVVDDLIKFEWARIPHFYTPFYVYQYATGFSAAIALSTRILEEGQPAVDAYLNFLCSGSSKDPIELLKEAGVDMASSEPIEAALSVFKSLIDEMQSL